MAPCEIRRVIDLASENLQFAATPGRKGRVQYPVLPGRRATIMRVAPDERKGEGPGLPGPSATVLLMTVWDPGNPSSTGSRVLLEGRLA